VPARTITRWFLEMTSPDQLAEAPARDPRLEVRRAEIPSPEFARFLYSAVGGPWWWVDRLGWDFERWRVHLERRELQTWVGWIQGTPAGYGELLRRGSDVELSFFGLIPSFMGQGIGPRLLHAIVTRAWAQEGTRRVHLSTCELDGPAARHTYARAGFAVYGQRRERPLLPDAPVEPWPGARRPAPAGAS
jgi:GNAT superfamily N-acetyltransferase